MKQLLSLSPILQMSKLSYKDMKKLALGHVASKQQSWEWNSGRQSGF